MNYEFKSYITLFFFRSAVFTKQATIAPVRGILQQNKERICLPLDDRADFLYTVNIEARPLKKV